MCLAQTIFSSDRQAQKCRQLACSQRNERARGTFQPCVGKAVLLKSACIVLSWSKVFKTCSRNMFERLGQKSGKYQDNFRTMVRQSWGHGEVTKMQGAFVSSLHYLHCCSSARFSFITLLSWTFQNCDRQKHDYKFIQVHSSCEGKRMQQAFFLRGSLYLLCFWAALVIECYRGPLWSGPL